MIEEFEKKLSYINQNIKELQEENKKKEEYFLIKNKNEENIKELNGLDMEIKSLIEKLNEQNKGNNDEIRKINDLYNKRNEIKYDK